MTYIGTVTRVQVDPATGRRVAYVEVAAIAVGYELGPCEVTTDLEATVAPSDRVLVAATDDRDDSYVVFGALAPA